MTNLQLLRRLAGMPAELSNEELGVSLELEGLSPEATYDPKDRCKIYALAIQLVQTSKGIKSESEGGYSISYSDPSIPGVISALANQSKCPELITMYNGRPKIRDKSKLW